MFKANHLPILCTVKINSFIRFRIKTHCHKICGLTWNISESNEHNENFVCRWKQFKYKMSEATVKHVYCETERKTWPSLLLFPFCSFGQFISWSISDLLSSCTILFRRSKKEYFIFQKNIIINCLMLVPKHSLQSILNIYIFLLCTHKLFFMLKLF